MIKNQKMCKKAQLFDFFVILNYLTEVKICKNVNVFSRLLTPLINVNVFA